MHSVTPKQLMSEVFEHPPLLLGVDLCVESLPELVIELLELLYTLLD